LEIDHILPLLSVRQDIDATMLANALKKLAGFQSRGAYIPRLSRVILQPNRINLTQPNLKPNLYADREHLDGPITMQTRAHQVIRSEPSFALFSRFAPSPRVRNANAGHIHILKYQNGVNDVRPDHGVAFGQMTTEDWLVHI
jgi:hypothetical protein